MKNHHCTRTRARCGQPPVSAGQTPHELDLGGLLDPQVTPSGFAAYYFGFRPLDPLISQLIDVLLQRGAKGY